jgi:BlaI family penicillinase repressor
MTRLPEAELTVMRAVWRLQHPAATGEIHALLEQERPWNLSALQTLLSRLTQKGFLRGEKKGRQNAYTPLVSEGDYLAFENRPFLQGRGLPGLVACLYESRCVSRQELEELRTFLDRAIAGEEES